VRYDRIAGPSITHKYDLLVADPDKPYLPKTDDDGNYEQLPSDIGTVNDEGVITSGSGDHPAAYAIAMLSVGSKAAIWPVVFKPKSSFKKKTIKQTVTRVPRAAQQVSHPAAPPPIVLGAKPASLPPSPAPPPVPTPGALNVALPVPSPPPSIAPVATPPVTPPAPPAPPPPPASPPATALQLRISPPGRTIPPPALVIPPPAPPIQPAPPGGARKEARQRQAATAKSESANAGGAEETQGNSDSGGDSQSMTRRDTRRDAYDFSARAPERQASAWTQDLYYGGGLTLLALTLALGWTAVRPRGRRREPDLPAPAWAPSERRR
jgi:hypothetical protein